MILKSMFKKRQWHFKNPYTGIFFFYYTSWIQSFPAVVGLPLLSLLEIKKAILYLAF
jgi:hypothetical protein